MRGGETIESFCQCRELETNLTLRMTKGLVLSIYADPARNSTAADHSVPAGGLQFTPS